MSELMALLDFLVDVVCLMPPLDELRIDVLTQDQAMYCCFASIALISASIVSGHQAASQQRVLWALVTALAFLIGVLSQPSLMRTIFVVMYPPLAICLRFLELSLVGARLSKEVTRARVALSVLGVSGVVVGAYYALAPLPAQYLTIAKTAWALLGVLVAAITWTKTMTTQSLIPGTIGVVGLFGVFASTLVYVVASDPGSIELILFQWSLPAGFLTGLLLGRFRAGPLRLESLEGTVE